MPSAGNTILVTQMMQAKTAYTSWRNTRMSWVRRRCAASKTPTSASATTHVLALTRHRVLYRLTRVPFPDLAYFGRAALLRFDAPDRSFGVRRAC